MNSLVNFLGVCRVSVCIPIVHAQCMSAQCVCTTCGQSHTAVCGLDSKASLHRIM